MLIKLNGAWTDVMGKFDNDPSILDMFEEREDD